MPKRLPPTTTELLRDEAQPYFLWWTDCTVGKLREHLASIDRQHSAYWLAALVREAHSRDVWLFTTPSEIRRRWPEIVRYLGRSRAMWDWLLDIPESDRFPRVPGHAQ